MIGSPPRAARDIAMKYLAMKYLRYPPVVLYTIGIAAPFTGAAVRAEAYRRDLRAVTVFSLGT
jgi:hypothetical protein